MTTEETTESAATERIDPRGVRSDLTVATESVEVETTREDWMDPRTLHRVRDLLLEPSTADPAPLSRDEIKSCAGSSLFRGRSVSSATRPA